MFLIGSVTLLDMEKLGKKSSRPSFGVFPQVLSTMLVVALIPLASLWLVNARLSQRDITDSISVSLQKTSDSLVLQANNWLDTNLRMLSYAARLESIRSMQSDAQKPVLKAMSDSYEWIFLAFTVTADGQNIGRNDDQNPADYYFGDRSYFKQVMQDDLDTGQQMLIGRTSGKPSLVLAKPVLNSDSKVGIVAMSAQVQEISDAVVSARVGNTGFAFLLDETGKVIAHGQPEALTQALQDFSSHPALRGEASEVFSYTLANKKFVTYTQKTDLGWTMVVQQDYNEAFASLRRSRQLGFALLLVTILLVVIIAFLLARRFVMPIQQLTQVADDISRGRLLKGEISEAQRSDEIGALAKAIERMRVSIDLAFQELRQK